jgi:hypothetical protein
MEPFCISETREGESTTTKPMSARLFGCGDHLGFRRDNHSGAAFIILLLWLLSTSTHHRAQIRIISSQIQYRAV